MKLIKLTAFTFLLCLMAGTLASCKHEGEYDYSKIIITYACSEDFLDFFTPKVLIDNGDGSQRMITLQRSDFDYADNTVEAPSLTGDEIITEKPLFCYITESLYELQGNFKATIVYEPVENWKIDYTKALTIYEGIADYKVEAFCQDGHSIKKMEEVLSTYCDVSLSPDAYLHLLSHKSIIFDLNYKVLTFDDDIAFEGDSNISIGSR